MKNILVTGGLGFIGSHTCVELINAGYNPVILDNLSNSDISVKSRIYEITCKDIPFFEGDVRDRHKLSQIFAAFDFYAVIHFAGLKAVAESVEQPLTYYDNNIGGAVALLDTMKEYDVRRFVFSSSATVYGEKNISPLTETMEVGGVTNPYGRTKLMIEKILGDLYISDPSWNIALLRYFNPIGAHESGLIGEDPKGIPNNLMPYITRVAGGVLPELSIFGNDYDTPDGFCIRDFIHVSDLAAGHVCALDHIEDCHCDAFNLGTGHGVSVMELVNKFMNVNGVDVPYRIAGRRQGDIAVVYADVSKAERILGFRAVRNVADMCSSSWKWQQASIGSIPE